MRTIAEFRVSEKFAPMLFAEDEGKKLGNLIRKIELQTTDPRYKRIGELQKFLSKNQGKPFFYGWSLNYKYSKHETKAASLLRLGIVSVFEPAGEECGTRYDELTACPHCGAGAKQITPLFLDTKRIPKSKDISRTIAGEVVVSRRVVELFARHAITGAKFTPVRLNPSLSIESADWFQLNAQNTNAEITHPTRVGINPFDEDAKGQYRCPCGDLIGLNLLSEVSIKAALAAKFDVVCSQQFVGTRRGLLRPERLIFASPKVWQLIELEKLKGIQIEVVHLA